VGRQWQVGWSNTFGPWTTAPHCPALPERFVVLAVNGDRVVHAVAGETVGDLTVGLDPDPNAPGETFALDEDGNLLAGDSIRWMVDFDEARAKGMALCVPISIDEAASGFDELHWRVNHAVAVGGQPPRRAVPSQAAAAVDALTGQGMGRRAATATALWYVLDLATRYAADGEDLVGGTPLSRLDSWALPALAALLQAAMPGALR